MRRFLLGFAAVSLALLGWHPTGASALGVLGALAALVGQQVAEAFDGRAKCHNIREEHLQDVATLKAVVEELRLKVVNLTNAAGFKRG